ncbi:uncharacterized protein RHIMIDRAFT_239338 [Rhizopus microsporus ATCC 52813]|uniref:Uncharacterized protein n=1 Tax=Rhizopus microsporus ATCC 52813 TaxID=1340429 RepID=A0A2G4SP21_RHIZD|nr:uncharacterized protein RHIMIDRAFT_239338 [Rhizopus microsporus ATCC 52813]PHZ10514.1 hypothetical protein RHIMIDRAFT_239338 [Rhizopus microsporus ATCC 52813]
MQCEQQVTAEPVVADVKKEEQHDTPIKPEEQTTVLLQQEQPMVPLQQQQQQQPLQTTLVTTKVPVSTPDTSTITTTATELIPPESTISTITTFEEIQKQLKSTLDHIEQRNMVSGFQTLSKATAAVVEHCEQLGLTSDDHPYNAIDREQFWAGLNNCWLYALAQRQEPSSDTERLTDQHLYNLRDMVVTWADKLERYGLVDYEMGWWEADILAAIDGILAMNYAAAQAAAQTVVAQAAAALFGDEVNL